MSRLIYNDVDMTFLRTKLYGAEVVSNGPDRVGTRHTLSAELYVHRRTVNLLVAVPPRNPEAPPEMYVDTAPASTAVSVFLAIRRRLLAKRKSLRLEVAGNVLAEVIINEAQECTIDLGPHPLACNLVAINGDGSFVIEYHIEWATPDRRCKESPPVLSQVWSADEDLDADYYPTRTVQGRIVFDPRVIGPGGRIHPDDMRGLLLPALPRGMMREAIHTHLSEDGVTLDYAVTDRLRACVVNHQSVTRIEASHTNTLTTPGPKDLAERMGGMMGIAGSVGKAAVSGMTASAALKAGVTTKAQQSMGAVAGRAASKFAGPVGWAVFAAELGSAMFSATALSYSAIVINVHSVQVTAYGHSESPYEDLDRAAISIGMYRLMRGSNAILSNYGGDTSLTHTADPRSSTFTASVKCAPRYPEGFTELVDTLAYVPESGWETFMSYMRWKPFASNEQRIKDERAKEEAKRAAQEAARAAQAAAVPVFPPELWKQSGYFGVFPDNVPEAQGGGPAAVRQALPGAGAALSALGGPGTALAQALVGAVGQALEQPTLEQITQMEVPTFFKLMLFRTEFGRSRTKWRDPFLTGPNFAGGLVSSHAQRGRHARPATGNATTGDEGFAEVYPKTILERQIVAALQGECDSGKDPTLFAPLLVAPVRRMMTT